MKVKTMSLFFLYRATQATCMRFCSSQKKSKSDLKAIKGRKLKKFYRDQNEIIEAMVSVKAEVDEEKQDFKIKIAMWLSLVANIILFALQLTGAIYSNSLSLVSTTIDAAMDLLSNSILFAADLGKHRKNKHKYPVGKARLEPVGILLFAALMSFMSLELMRTAVTAFIDDAKPDLHVNVLPITLVSVAIVLKLALWIFCRTLTYSPTALTLAQDHRNDVGINVFGLTTAILGQYIQPWVDPAGCIIIALLILRSWASTAYEQMLLLIGIATDDNFLKKITYTAMQHSSEILKVDSCRAFHVGSDVYVEVDIVLPEDMPLKNTHDIGESLQNKLEEIGRAHV